jgi:uncharacterized protein YbjT (DUF2867 family)
MKILLFGTTGMVGAGALLECLDDPRVERVLSVSRRPCGMRHAKLEEQVHPDLADVMALSPRWEGVDACLFCLGVSAAGLDEDSYTRVTHDLTLAVARALLERSPHASFCYVSGQGTDSSGSGRVMWARIKGRTENDLLRLPFQGAWMFRPGVIQPRRGVRSRTRLYQAFYSTLGWTLPLARLLAPRQIVDSVELGRALLRAARTGASKRVLEPPDILILANEEIREREASCSSS